MGKTKKRKKKGQGEDFKKVKGKVGKKRPPAVNVTKTTFKAAAIHLPEQLKETDDPSNQRNLTLKASILKFLLLKRMQAHNPHQKANL